MTMPVLIAHMVAAIVLIAIVVWIVMLYRKIAQLKKELAEARGQHPDTTSSKS